MITLTIQELAQTQAAFQQLPPSLVVEASHLIEAEANYAAFQIRSQYPAGGLRDGVEIQALSKTTAYAGYRIVSKDYKTYWWEYGTAIRHTSEGWYRGQMKRRPQPVLVPTVQRARAAMWVQLRDLLVRAGLLVTG